MQEDIGDPEYIPPNEESEVNFDILGAEAEATWSPPKKSFSWFKKVADLNLNDDQIDKIRESYSLSSFVAEHFDPSRFPNSIWQKFLTSSYTGNSFKIKTIFKSQSNISLAMMPLLSVLDSFDPSDTANIKCITLPQSNYSAFPIFTYHKSNVPQLLRPQNVTIAKPYFPFQSSIIRYLMKNLKK